ncbi:MAG: serine/threonine protein kinase [Acidimicrobiia bacterium]
MSIATFPPVARPRDSAWAGQPGQPLPATAELIEASLRRVRVHSRASNQPVVIEYLPPVLRLVGYGTDAVVVQHPALPGHVFKIFTPETEALVADEYAAYQRLAGSPLFTSCVGRGEFFLVLTYEPGPTLYECLVDGLVVDPVVLEDVEAARGYARAVGLHPKDIHLKNVVVQDGRGKVLDVSKYVLPGDEDRVWEHLAEGYRRFYPLIRGRRIPVGVIELAKRIYRAQAPEDFSLDAFAGRMLRILRTVRLAGGSRAA